MTNITTEADEAAYIGELFDAPAKTHDEQIALIHVAQHLEQLARFARKLADSTNRNEAVYQRAIKSTLPNGWKSLAILEAEVGRVNNSDLPRFSGEHYTQESKAAGGVLVIPAPDDGRATLTRKSASVLTIGSADEPVPASPNPKDEIVIERSKRGYKFTLPVAPCEAAIKGMRNAIYKISYHESTPDREAYRLFPVDCLAVVLNLLKYWFEESPGGIGEHNRNGGQPLAVRVSERMRRYDENKQG